jgi:hypothetical protein
MMNHAKLAGLSALLAALIFAAPVAAGGPEKKPTTIDDLAKQLDLMKASLDARLDKIEEGHRLDAKAIASDITELREKVARLERALRRNTDDIRDLHSRSETRGSLSVDPLGPAARAATGTLRLENRLGVQATAIIDGVAYTVPALSVVTLRNRPAGALTYQTTAEGFGMRAPTRTTLGANETLTLTIY